MLRNEPTRQPKPMFSQRHYAAIAEVIKVEREYCSFYIGAADMLILSRFVRDLVFVFRKDNPNFNEQKFREACGIT